MKKTLLSIAVIAALSNLAIANIITQSCPATVECVSDSAHPNSITNCGSYKGGNFNHHYFHLVDGGSPPEYTGWNTAVGIYSLFRVRIFNMGVMPGDAEHLLVRCDYDFPGIQHGAGEQIAIGNTPSLVKSSIQGWKDDKTPNVYDPSAVKVCTIKNSPTDCSFQLDTLGEFEQI